MSRLEVIAGPMFSGKTTELLRRINRHQLAGHSVALHRPEIDVRYSDSEVISHTGQKCEAITIPVAPGIMKSSKAYVQAFDEAQFLSPNWFLTYVKHQMGKDRIVIVAGLDMDAFGEPFGAMPDLMAWADTVDKLSAVCMACGKDACMTYKLSNSQDVVDLGGKELYEARCRKHWAE